MSENEVLKNMVMTFRVSELTNLLSFAGRSRSGRKTELQVRALDLIKMKSQPINAKIRELYRTVQQQAAMQITPETAVPAPYLGSTAGRSAGTLSQLSPSKTAAYSLADVERATLQGRNPYTGGLPYTPSGYTSKAASGSSGFPVHPDVRLKKLPFFDTLSELLRPSTLAPQGNSRYHDTNFVFHLTPQQATDIASSRDARPGSKLDFTCQIQLRFCLLETSCEQEDNFPSNLAVKVNGKMVALPNPIPTNKPGVEPKRPPRPVNITSLARLSPTVANQINVTWASDMGGRGYVMAAYVVNRLTSSDLLQRLKTKGLRAVEYTRGLIKDKLEDADTEIATTSLKVSLVCPLGKMRMQLPCRATTCTHLQCFDASLFLQMNERKPTWVCPVCDKGILYDNLAIDGYFSEILHSSLLPSDSMEVQLNVDGTWTVLSVKKETHNGTNSTSNQSVNVDAVEELGRTCPKVETIDEVEFELVCDGPPPAKKRAPVVVDLCSSSEDEDETLSDIKNRILERQRQSSQSSRPSTADSVENNSNTPTNLSTGNNGSGNPISSSSSSVSRPANSFESGVNGSHPYPFLGTNYASPTYFPYGSSTPSGTSPYARSAGYYAYGGPNDVHNLLGNAFDSNSLLGSSIGAPSAQPLSTGSLLSSGVNSTSYRSPSPPDVISLD